MQWWAKSAIFIIVSVIAWSAAAAETVSVSQQNRKFMPDNLVISSGSSVHFINDDKVTHQIYVDSKVMTFYSEEQPMGKTIDVLFDHAGTFVVRCAIHPSMRLTVTVQ